jgi:hypothetical protein
MIRTRAPIVRWLALVALVALAAVTSACAKTYIPNTDVEDTGANRSVIEFCETYRHALEDKNVGQLVKLMSPGYFEDGGNTKNDDDADYDAIRGFLTGDFLKTTGIRYEIRYRRVTFTEKNHVYIDYTYAAAWKLPGAPRSRRQPARPRPRRGHLQDRRRDVTGVGICRGGSVA